MNLQVGVKILLRNEKGEYLLLERSKEKYPEVGTQWDIPGGRIDIGVSLLENLKREVMEETGLELEGEPEFISAQDILKEDKHVVRLTYIGKAQGEIKLSDEHDEYTWVALDDIKNLGGVDLYVKEALKLV
ncbi:MAG: NUDIX domain-containing protein [Patescibacteria group bacterium]